MAILRCGSSIRTRRRSSIRNVDVCASIPRPVTVSQGLDTGDVVVTAGVQALRPGQKVRLLGLELMKPLNLSEWALNHRSLVAYLMIVAVAAGVLSYFRLGRDEDPSFVIKTMVVKAVWPGATTEDTLNQVTERLERTLEETPHLDFLRSFTTSGSTTIFVNLKGSTSATAGRRYLVSRAQEHCRYPAHVAVWHVGTRSSTTSLATRSELSTASPRTDSRSASCATMSRTFARNCSVCQMSPRSTYLERKTSRSSSSSPCSELATLGIDQRRFDRGATGAEYRQTRPA